jgi:hypothetical protein
MEEAQKSLARSRGIPKEEVQGHFIILREVEEIKSSVQYEKQTRGGWIDCFRPKNKTLYRTLLGMSLQSLQQLTGANYFFYYGASVFKAVGLSDSFVTQIILGAVNFVCTFGGMYVLERVSDFVIFKCVVTFLTGFLVRASQTPDHRRDLAVSMAFRFRLRRNRSGSYDSYQHREM